MRPIRHLVAGPAAVAVLVLAAACGTSTPDATAPAASAGAASTQGSAPGSSTAAGAGAHEVGGLKTAQTSLGTVVTDGNGMTLYMFDKDTQGGTTSACTGQCLAAWPPALQGASAPTATGVTGTVSTIATPDGSQQLTLDGWPLYYYAPDSAPGDVKGQGVNDVWWVLDAAGTPVKGAGGSGAVGGGY
jgi:predicted lipoprotein with Yx(FWY)xxD motif